MKKTFFLFVFLMINLAISAQSMKYSFNAGDKIGVKQIASVVVDQELMGMKMVLGTKITNSLEMEIETVASEIAKIKMWYTDVAMDLEVTTGSATPQIMHINSSDTPEDPGLMEAHRLINSMVDEPFYIYVRTNGTIENVEGIEVLEEKMKAAVTDEAILKDLGDDFSQEKLRSDFSRFFVPYPSEKLLLGSTWISSISIPDLNIIDGQQSWSVENKDSELNRLSIKSVVKDVKVVKNEENVEMNLEGDFISNYSIDGKSGWADSIEISSKMKGNARMSIEGTYHSWPVLMNMSSDISFTKK